MFFITLLFTFLIILIALLVFWKIGAPVYRLEKVNVIQLLELIIEGVATEADWAVFSGVPIHHNPELAAIQHRCLEIAENEYTAGKAYLFSQKGLVELAVILNELKEDSGVM